MKILLAEDDVMIADCLADALLHEGHSVCGIAATVAEAVKLARLHRPDIAILDLYMRGSERGTEIADQLAAAGELGHMGILYVSGETSRLHQKTWLGHACLSKPYTLDAVNDALEIVREIAIVGATSRKLPRGLQLLRPNAALRQPAV
jgi:DNA-binding response OmpR family regulator